jgi:hypothetical protein
MKRHVVKIDDREFTAVMNLNAMEEIAEIARENAEDPDAPVDVDTIIKVAASPYGLIRAVMIMIREGEALEGRECDIDEAWMKTHLDPRHGMWLEMKAIAIMTEAMRMETEIGQDKEVDAVLERIKKKGTKDE